MSVDNFMFNRLGNKAKDIQYFEKYLPDQKSINVVAEPFAGSFAVIRKYFFNVPKIICGDNDIKFITKIDNNLKHLKEFEIFRDKYNNWLKNKQGLVSAKQAEKYIQTIRGNIQIDVSDVVARGYTKSLSNVDYSDLAKLWKRILWYDDYSKVFKVVKNNKNAFVFIDPPYLSSDNKNYHGVVTTDKDNRLIDNTVMFMDIMKFMHEAKCKVMMIINKNAINEYIFEDFIVGHYDKVYALSKRLDKLLICTNY